MKLHTIFHLLKFYSKISRQLSTATNGQRFEMFLTLNFCIYDKQYNQQNCKNKINYYYVQFLVYTWMKFKILLAILLVIQT